MNHPFFALGGAALLALPASAQATFTLMGSGQAADMNADGTAVVGRDNQGAFLWTAAGGYVPLSESDAVSVSEDGTVVLGNITDVNGMSAAGRWEMSTGWVSLDGLGSSSGNSLSSAYGMSGDGSRATGLGWLNAGTAGAFDWSVTGGMTQLPQMGPNSSRGNCVSVDGLWVGGWDEDPTGPRRAAIWGPAGETLPLVDPMTNPEGIGEVYAFSTDGRFAVGSNLDSAFVFDQMTNTLTNFGILPGCCGGFFDAGFSQGVSDDGSTVVGLFGSGPFSFVGTIWTPGGGYQRLDDVLTAQGANLNGYTITSATDISPDGLTILGSAVPAGSFSAEWFIATLDTDIGTTYCSPAVVNSTGVPAEIAATGSVLVADNSLFLSLSNLPANSFTFAICSMTQDNQPMVGGSQGTICVGGSVGRFVQQIQNSGPDGTASVLVDLTAVPQPNGSVVATAGESWNFQAWYRDANPMSTSNFTDAVEITFQ